VLIQSFIFALAVYFSPHTIQLVYAIIVLQRNNISQPQFISKVLRSTINIVTSKTF